ncbi:MAG TPA: M23 family metallopeptidase [Chryseosolibacter sp.]|nr:M23 family metallopeptidase [Chryseosolibacter sp.]
MKNPILLLPLIFFASCNGLQSIKSALSPPSPYEHYVESLKTAGLLDTAMARGWLAAGERALNDSIVLALPFSESGFVEAGTPQARGYKFTAKDGQVLTVKASVKASPDAKVFVELFVRDDQEWERVAHADSTRTLTYEFRHNEECVLRLQPELLANVWYAVDISLTPVLINPVAGATNKSIGSFYGAPRDNGRRSHEGVDIFAPKGTPVLAPTDGYISRVGLNRLGGKVVWMKDLKRGHSYYFAHLDSQMVEPGMRVYQGHVLGLVGNTGNAKRTPPHLHFGIYQSGSKDPLHYIRQMEQAMASVPIDTGFQQKPFKVARKMASVFFGPSLKSDIKASIEKNTYVTVLGQTNEWYRIALPDNLEGYIPKNQVTPLTAGRQYTLDSAAILLTAVDDGAVPIEVIDPSASVEVLAHYKEHSYIRASSGNAGWIVHDRRL